MIREIPHALEGQLQILAKENDAPPFTVYLSSSLSEGGELSKNFQKNRYKGASATSMEAA